MGPQKSSKAPDSQSGFVFVNQGPGVRDSKPTKGVRAHAMREALRRKKLGKSTDIQERGTALPYKTERFRLGISQPITGNQGFGNSTAPDTKVENEMVTDITVGKRNIKNMSPSLALPEPSMLIDPFYSLPMKLGSRQQKLLYYYHNYFVQNSLALNHDRKLLKISAVDTAWLHATFSLVARSYDFHSGTAQTQSADSLYYRGKALRLVNEVLNSPSGDIAEPVIGAVATLCNIDIFNGNLTGAGAHMNGLERLVMLKGGLRNLGNFNSFVPKLVCWSDVAYASTFGGKLRFPLYQPSVSPSVLEKYHWKRFPCPVSHNDHEMDLHEAYKDLLALSSIAERQILQPEDREFFSLSITASQYRIANTLGDLDNPTTLTRASFVHRSSHLAALIYLNTTLREIVLSADMHHHMAKRLKAVLEEGQAGNNNTTIIWEDQPTRLLWIAFIGASVTENRPERAFFVSILLQVTNLLMISSLEQFQNVVRGFGWRERISLPHCLALWREVQALSLNNFLVAQDLDDLILDDEGPSLTC